MVFMGVVGRIEVVVVVVVVVVAVSVALSWVGLMGGLFLPR
jgi:hypothetical protein